MVFYNSLPTQKTNYTSTLIRLRTIICQFYPIKNSIICFINHPNIKYILNKDSQLSVFPSLLRTLLIFTLLNLLNVLFLDRKAK